MIKLKLADEEVKEKLNIKYDAFVCFDANAILGFCEFVMNKENLFIEKINCEDNPIADGLIRQTMSYALDHDCKICNYSEQAKETMFSVKIIKSFEQNEIDILDFFLKLNCC